MSPQDVLSLTPPEQRSASSKDQYVAMIRNLMSANEYCGTEDVRWVTISPPTVCEYWGWSKVHIRDSDLWHHKKDMLVGVKWMI